MLYITELPINGNPVTGSDIVDRNVVATLCIQSLRKTLSASDFVGYRVKLTWLKLNFEVRNRGVQSFIHHYVVDQAKQKKIHHESSYQ